MCRRLLLIVFTFALLVSVAPPALAQQNADLAREAIARINAWRIREGLWPLRPNPTLDALAMYQAEYLVSLSLIPDGPAIHLGRQGEHPAERAQWAEFNWPTYGARDRIALSEIACARHSTGEVITFWQTSPDHLHAALNNAYREIGVAAVERSPGYYLYIAVLAGRPNVLPALIDPGNGTTLYLSDERYWGAGNCHDCIRAVTQVRVLDARGNVLVDWTRWQRILTLPYLPGEPFTVEYFDGMRVLPTVVDPTVDVALLPGFAPPTATSEATDEVGVRMPTVQPTDIPTVTPPTDVSAPPVPPTDAPAADVLLIYDDHALSLINASSHLLNLNGLQLACGGMLLDVERWDTEYLYSSLDAFPAGHCLQTWPFGASDPPACASRDAWITARPEEQVWTDCDFEVRQYGALLVTCLAGAGQCTVDLPGQ